MGWIILGIIFFLIELYVTTHTYKSDWGKIGESPFGLGRIYGIIKNSEVKLPLTVGRLLILIIANIIPIVNIGYFIFFVIWWAKRASDPEDADTTCVIWRFKFGKFTEPLLTKLSNLLNREL